MDKYIGIDVHAASCTIAVVDASGKQTGSHVVATNGQEIVECLRAIAGQRHVCFEEGTQSGWLYEILEPHAVEVVVAGVEAGRRGPKDDKRDAFGLAEDLRQGAIKTRVFKNGGPYKALRELARTHRMVVRDVVRTKNRIKSMYRSRGVAVAGKSVYSSAGREPWQEQLPEACRGPVRMLYAELDALEEVRNDAEKALVQEARKFPITKLLSTCPGLGPIRAAQLVPIVGYAPSEYRTKPWPQEVLIEGWFPHLAREQDGFRVDGTTDSNTPAPRSLRQRSCGSRHTPLSGDRRIDHPFLTTSIYSRTRVDAGCHNKRIAGRWVIVLLDILFHRSHLKRHFAFTE